MWLCPFRPFQAVSLAEIEITGGLEKLERECYYEGPNTWSMALRRAPMMLARAG